MALSSQHLRYMKKLFILFIFLFSIQSVFAQLNFLPKFIRQMYFKKDSSLKPSFVLLPALSSAPETGVEFGGAALLSFYTDTIGHNTRVSSLFGYSTITTKGQAKLSLNANYWTPQNKFHYTGVISYYNYPFNFYGIGNNTRLSALDHVAEKRYKLGITGEKRFGDYFYLGYVAGVIKYFYKYDPNLKSTINSDPEVEDGHGGANVYIGPSFTFDTRNNNTYTTKGMIISSYYNIMHGVYANNSYAGGFFNIEYSQFFLLARKLVLGVDIQEQSLTGSRSPFFLLPQMGSDEMMRGYYQGRYRDRNYIAGQTELRYRVDNRFGIVGFVGTGEVFHSTFSTAQLKPNYGGGVRYFFDVEKGLAIRLDYGVGQKPQGEKRESGFYIALGQSF
ncbi:hypothetical protein SAMN05216524_11188 [Mucilaginibacter sp. OK098]|nr:hypothetical protein SAMN05216524_11188 [Mucilaginibacter sp. OK098]